MAEASKKIDADVQRRLATPSKFSHIYTQVGELVSKLERMLIQSFVGIHLHHNHSESTLMNAFGKEKKFLKINLVKGSQNVEELKGSQNKDEMKKDKEAKKRYERALQEMVEVLESNGNAAQIRFQRAPYSPKGMVLEKDHFSNNTDRTADFLQSVIQKGSAQFNFERWYLEEFIYSKNFTLGTLIKPIQSWLEENNRHFCGELGDLPEEVKKGVKDIGEKEKGYANRKILNKATQELVTLRNKTMKLREQQDCDKESEDILSDEDFAFFQAVIKVLAKILVPFAYDYKKGSTSQYEEKVDRMVVEMTSFRPSTAEIEELIKVYDLALKECRDGGKDVQIGFDAEKTASTVSIALQELLQERRDRITDLELKLSTVNTIVRKINRNGKVQDYWADIEFISELTAKFGGNAQPQDADDDDGDDDDGDW